MFPILVQAICSKHHSAGWRHLLNEKEFLTVSTEVFFLAETTWNSTKKQNQLFEYILKAKAISYPLSFLLQIST